MNKNVIDFIS